MNNAREISKNSTADQCFAGLVTGCRGWVQGVVRFYGAGAITRIHKCSCLAAKVQIEMLIGIDGGSAQSGPGGGHC